jgi:hypothetical protein
VNGQIKNIQDLTDEELAAELQKFNQQSVQPQAPKEPQDLAAPKKDVKELSDEELFQEWSKVNTPVIKDESADISPFDRGFVQNFGGETGDKINYLKQQYPDYEIQATKSEGVLGGDDIIVRKPGEKEFKKLDPSSWKSNLNPIEMIQDVTDAGYDLFSSAASGIAAGVAGIPSSFVSTPAGGLAAGALAGGATSAGLERLRQFIGKRFGANEYNMKDVLLSGALGSASPLLLGSGTTKEAVKAAFKNPQTVSKVLEKQSLGYIKPTAKSAGKTSTALAEEVWSPVQKGLLSSGAEKALGSFGLAPAQTIKNATKELSKPMINFMSKFVKINPNVKQTNQEVGRALLRQDALIGFGDVTSNTIKSKIDDRGKELSNQFAEGLEKMGVKFDYSGFGDDLKKHADMALASGNQAIRDVGEAATDLFQRFFTPGKINKETGLPEKVLLSPKETQMLIQEMKNFTKAARSTVSWDKKDANQKNLSKFIIDASKRLEDQFYGVLEKQTENKNLRKEYFKNKEFLRKLLPQFDTEEKAARNLLQINSPNKAILRQRLKQFDQNYMKNEPVKIMDLAEMADVAKFLGDPSLEAISSGGATSTGKILKAGEFGGTAGWLAAQATGSVGLQPLAAQAGRTAGQFLASPSTVAKILSGKTAVSRGVEAGKKAAVKALEPTGLPALGRAASARVEKLPTWLQPAVSQQALTQAGVRSIWDMMGD